MAPQWFVVNAADARWLHNELGAYCPFEGRGVETETRSPQEAYAPFSKPEERPPPDMF